MTEHQQYLSQQIGLRRLLMWTRVGMNFGLILVLGLSLWIARENVWNIVGLRVVSPDSRAQADLVILGIDGIIALVLIANAFTHYIKTMNELMLIQTLLSIDANMQQTADALIKATRRGQ